MLPPVLFGEVAREYRRISDDQRFTVTATTQLPCEGPGSCAYEELPGGDYITVYPQTTPAQSTTTNPAAPTYVPTQVVAGRSFKDVALEALALGMMGGGAVAFGYGLGKPSTPAVIGGLVLVFAGAGLRIGVLWPWFSRTKNALLAPGTQRVT